MNTDPQYYLTKLAEADKPFNANDPNFFNGCGFLNTESNWDSHRPLLYLTLCLTNSSGEPVIEMGSGEGSTPLLRNYCQQTKRGFESYESNFEWAEKMGSMHVQTWDNDDRWKKQCSVLFVDHAPGEHRHKAVKKMMDLADIIVMHDTELNGAGAYNYEYLFPMFRYVLHFNRLGGGAGASAVSQTFDLNRYKFLSLGNYKFE